MEEFKKMVSGEDYNPNVDYLQSMRAETRASLVKFNTEPDDKVRGEILNALIGSLGDKCFITPPFFCDYGKNITLGDGVYFNANCTILDCAEVKVGSNTMIGPNVQIYTPVHPLEYRKRNSGLESAKPISIGENSWIGGGAIILPGVNVGNGCVIGAGAVVTKDIPDNAVAMGNPARVVKIIEQ